MAAALGGPAAARGVRLPAGRAGPCRDGAVAGPPFGAPKGETCHPRSFAAGEGARAAPAEPAEGRYNRRRPRPTIDHRIPAGATAALFERADAMAAREGALPLAA